MATTRASGTHEASGSSVELLPLEGCTSEVWKYFGFPGKNGKIIEADKSKRTNVCCKLCMKKIKYCGNTSNLRSHLEREHKKEFQALLNVEVEKAKEKGESSASNQQPRISNVLKDLIPIARNSTRWYQLTKSVCYFIGKDMQPYDTIEDPGFVKMLQTFEPRYSPPSRKTIATNYMPKLFEAEKTRVLKLVQSISDRDYYAITTDLWTSRANHSYCCLTIHYVSADFTLQSHLLETKEFPDSHTAENVAEELKGILNQWELSVDNLVAATTDNCSNMVLALSINHWNHIPCLSHILNLAVQKVLALPIVSKAVARCRRLVSHFHHSSKSSYMLKVKQADLKHDTHILIGDVVTRWNSTFYMIARVLEQQQPLCAALLALKKGDLMPSDAEFAVMETYVEVMKPIVDVTEGISAQKWVTISAVRPILHKLLNVTLVEQESDTSEQKAIKSAMRLNLQGRYTGSVEMLLCKAAFLDHRMKSLPYLSEAQRDEVKNAICDEAEAVLESEADLQDLTTLDDNVEKNEPPPSKKSKGEHKLFEFIGDIIDPDEQEQTITAYQKAYVEVKRYRDATVTVDEKNESPLVWWKNNTTRYPILSKLAKKYLAIPATSVPSERAFSIAGHISNVKRACLLPGSVNMLVFLAENLQ